MSAALNLRVDFAEPFTCASCGIPMVLSARYETERRQDGKGFFCPNGHSLVFRNSEFDKLKRRAEDAERALDAAKARAVIAENAARAHKGKVTEIKNRVGNGVCPCCNRSFTNLRRHMHTKHPDYKKGEP